MPHTHAVLLPQIVTSTELRKFVEGEGGEWQDDALLPQGIITKGEAALFIRGVDDQENLWDVSVEEMHEAQRTCGKPIVAMLTLDHSRGQESISLARRVSDDMVRLWGGYVIDAGG